MSLLIDGPAGAVSFEAKGTYGQTLAQIQVRLAEEFKVVNYGRTEVSGTLAASLKGRAERLLPPFIRR